MTDLREAIARTAYETFCAMDPIEPREPVWGRGGFKTEIAVWNAIADRILAIVGGWRPIETAPKDGTPVLVFEEYGLQEVAKYVAKQSLWCIEMIEPDGSFNATAFPPTHWQPLPEPPHTPKEA